MMRIARAPLLLIIIIGAGIGGSLTDLQEGLNGVKKLSADIRVVSIAEGDTTISDGKLVLCRPDMALTLGEQHIVYRSDTLYRWFGSDSTGTAAFDSDFLYASRKPIDKLAENFTLALKETADELVLTGTARDEESVVGDFIAEFSKKGFVPQSIGWTSYTGEETHIYLSHIKMRCKKANIVIPDYLSFVNF